MQKANTINATSLSLCKACYCMTKTIKGKCGKCQARKLDVQATEQRLLKIIEAGEEARGKTWEARFDQKYPLGGEIWVLERHRDELKSFIRTELATAHSEGERSERERIIKMLQNDEVRKAEASGEYENGFDYGFDEAIARISALTPETIKETNE